VDVRFCDEFEHGLGWIRDEAMARCSHALVVDGGVWLVDPLDAPALEGRLRGLGEPRGVVQLLDRHERDCAALAARLGVPHHRVPSAVGGAPFELLPVARSRWWREVALWWPQKRALVCADAVGTVGYFVARGERLGVHPLLRLRPPRSLRGLTPSHILCGHGEGLHGDEAPSALEEALATARRRLPAAYLSSMRYWVGHA
jgi:hypothetical protein